MKRRTNKSETSRELAQEILAMVAKDQRMRKSGTWNASIDKRNTKRLKEIIKKYGWPTFSLVGEEAAHGAWLLAQHADTDIRFQKRALALMKKAAARKEVDKKHLAYLTDRILVYSGKPQLYGTQFFTDKKGVFGPRPIKDPPRLAARRKKFDLAPFSSYVKRIKLMNRQFLKLKKRAS